MAISCRLVVVRSGMLPKQEIHGRLANLQRKMPLYELVMIARSTMVKSASPIAYGHFVTNSTDKANLKSLLTFCAKHVLDNKGVVRQFTNSGPKQLPYRMKRHQQIFDEGSYLTMKFDSSPKTMINLSKALGLNDSVIRHTILKVGDSLEQVTTYVDPKTVKGNQMATQKV